MIIIINPICQSTEAERGSGTMRWTKLSPGALEGFNSPIRLRGEEETGTEQFWHQFCHKAVRKRLRWPLVASVATGRARKGWEPVEKP
jgi:hypothetical protein